MNLALDEDFWSRPNSPDDSVELRGTDAGHTWTATLTAGDGAWTGLAGIHVTAPPGDQLDGAAAHDAVNAATRLAARIEGKRAAVAALRAASDAHGWGRLIQPRLTRDDRDEARRRAVFLRDLGMITGAPWDDLICDYLAIRPSTMRRLLLEAHEAGYANGSRWEAATAGDRRRRDYAGLPDADVEEARALAKRARERISDVDSPVDLVPSKEAKK
jgi:hypothetical protein